MKITCYYLGLFGIILLINTRATYGQNSETTSPDSVTISNSDSSPNSTPYTTSRSAAGHILAFPSYLFEWGTKPLEWGLKVTEKKLPQLLQGERGDYGVFPLFELGGDIGFSYGLLLFHNRPFYPNHSARIEALFGSSDYNDFDFGYEIDRFLSEKGQLDIDATYSNRPDRVFILGNDASLDERSFFDREDVEIAASYRYNLFDKSYLSLNSDYLRRKITPSDRQLEENAPGFPERFLSTDALLSTGLMFELDKASGVPRINRGYRLITDLQWSRSLTNDKYHYLNYHAEWNQFIPVPFLPDDRRLAFKGELYKAEAIGNKDIPFYEKPSLGSSRNLRGFSFDRFRDSGSLLFTLEYRYPLWDFSDVVLFVDEGQVFNNYSDIGINDFHTSYGFGFHLISSKGFAFRSEFAFSRETSRFILLISPNF